MCRNESSYAYEDGLRHGKYRRPMLRPTMYVVTMLRGGVNRTNEEGVVAMRAGSGGHATRATL